MKILLAMFLFSSVAQAGYDVECGDAFKARTDDDILSGKNEAIWNISIGERWFEDGVTRSRMFLEEEAKVLRVSVTHGSGTSEMGKMFEITDLKIEQPELHVYEVGGFVGYVRVASYNCEANRD